MGIVKVLVTYSYTLEIDENDSIVKEYDSQNDLIGDCASYRFKSVLPVIGNGGVKITDVEVFEITEY